MHLLEGKMGKRFRTSRLHQVLQYNVGTVKNLSEVTISRNLIKVCKLVEDKSRQKRKLSHANKRFMFILCLT